MGCSGCEKARKLREQKAAAQKQAAEEKRNIVPAPVKQSVPKRPA